MSKILSIQEERELIYLLLHNKNAIDRFYDSGLSSKQFSEENIPIIIAIIETFDKDNVLLTRKSFKEKLKLNTIPKERISQELAFNSCYAASADMEDFPMLIQKVIDFDIENSITETLEQFYKNSKKNGNILAIKSLINKCEDILQGSSTLGGESYYEDIRVLTKIQIQHIEDIRSGKIKEDPLILSGIREIDYAMGEYVFNSISSCILSILLIIIV